MSTTTRDIRLSAKEQELALDETQVVLAAVVDPERRERLELLHEAIAVGALPPEQAEALERILELALQSGRIRATYGPGGEQTGLALYRRLPAGAGLAESASAVSDALSALHGKPLDAVSLQALGPGVFTLRLAADGVELSVRLDRQGARLATVEA